jgi:hypothetical protein
MSTMLPVMFAAIQLAVVSLEGGGGQAVPRDPQPPIFRFEADEFWLNLHHFLYVLGRAEAKTADASREAVAGAPADEARGLEALTPEERRTWREAVSSYATGPSKKDLIFDGPLAATTRALADADAATSLSGISGTGIDAAAIATLERAAPIYRQAWWPAHRASNHARQSEIQALVDRHGRVVLQFITHAYGMEWPAQDIQCISPRGRTGRARTPRRLAEATCLSFPASTRVVEARWDWKRSFTKACISGTRRCPRCSASTHAGSTSACRRACRTR